MDKRIAYINAQKGKDIFPMNLVVTKKLKSDTHTVSYILVPSIVEVINEILTTKKLVPKIYEDLKKANHITDNRQVTQVGFIGKLEDFSGHSEAVFKFKVRKIDIREGRDPFYRNYKQELATQKEMMSFYNSCRTSQQSWFSAIAKCGSKYGLLLTIKTPL